MGSQPLCAELTERTPTALGTRPSACKANRPVNGRGQGRSRRRRGRASASLEAGRSPGYFGTVALFREGKRRCKARAACVARSRSHIQLSSSALCAIAHWGGRSSIPETAMIEPRSRGVLDPRLRGNDGGICVAKAIDLHLTRGHRDCSPRSRSGRLEGRDHHRQAERECPRNKPEPEWIECRILHCSKSIKAVPSNGQWQFRWLVCIGAGMQAPGARARVPGK